MSRQCHFIQIHPILSSIAHLGACFSAINLITPRVIGDKYTSLNGRCGIKYAFIWCLIHALGADDRRPLFGFHPKAPSLETSSRRPWVVISTLPEMAGVRPSVGSKGSTRGVDRRVCTMSTQMLCMSTPRPKNTVPKPTHASKIDG